jgi:surfeit locus 1 family protein
MTSEARERASAPGFPVALTLAAALAFALLVGLGVWQLDRLQWKERELARITQRQTAAAQPIGPVLAQAAKGADVSFTPVTALCGPAPPERAVVRLVTDQGDWIARVLSPCRLAGRPYDGLLVDRGFLLSSRGSTMTPDVTLPPPRSVTGVLFARPEGRAPGLAHPAPYVIVASAEAPEPAGVTPAPYNGDAAEKLQYVGAYAPTWFGLAGVLACVYAAMLWRRYHPKA